MDIIGTVRLFSVYIQEVFCMEKHLGLYHLCSAICEAELCLGSLYSSCYNTLQKWQIQQHAFQNSGLVVVPGNCTVQSSL